jgi:hypothetical protein
MDPDGPGARAGLQIGDLILAADGRPVESVREFALYLYRHAVDATVELDVRRDKEKRTLRATVVERPDDPSRFLEMVRPETNLVPQLDLLGIDVDTKLATALTGLRLPIGVLVAAMSAEAAPPADRFRQQSPQRSAATSRIRRASSRASSAVVTTPSSCRS